MNNRIRILGIVPYENMKNLIASLAEEYPQIDLTLFVGDREKGLEIAKQNFHGNYDAVIARGGTASMLKKNLALPVIEIKISTYDLLCSLRLAGGLDKRVALVCADNIAHNARRLQKLMDLKMDIHAYNSREAAETAILHLNPEEYDVLMCDMVAYTTAKTQGLNAFLIISGADNIRQAFDQAILLYSSQEHLRSENMFLRELLECQIGYTTILDDDGNLYLSTMDMLSPDLLAMLRRELPESMRTSERRVTRRLNGALYMIRIRRISVGNVSYTAFFYDIRKTPLGTSYTGIQTFTRPEVEDRYCKSIFSTTGFPSDAQSKLEKISKSSNPVIITGEDGTGKESAVDILYLQSSLRNNPLIQINFAAIGEKEWNFLMEHHNSPLADEGSTLYFVNAETLSKENCLRLISTLKEMRVCNRNRVFFSCICSKEASMPKLMEQIANSLCCLTLELPSLQKLSSRIPMMVNMYLSRTNDENPHQLLGAEPQAMELLQQYNWPHNYSQFSRVMNELVVTASGQFITASEVRALLRKERHVGSFFPRAENADIPLDLTRPLSEINREIVRRVVEETGGNQTAAAKRLGISRTTLWRVIQADNTP